MRSSRPDHPVPLVDRQGEPAKPTRAGFTVGVSSTQGEVFPTPTESMGQERIQAIHEAAKVNNGHPIPWREVGIRH